jgi:sensor histidine kinase YesM
MLGAFTDYLRASLGGLRRDEVTLGEELALAEAYLRVQATRMEERLRFSIEADEATRQAPLLPLLLQPLVENAVQHGLEPQVAGGTVSVFARTEGDEVVVEVRDDGRGLDASADTPLRRGAGLALANVRERLVSAFGADASLTLAPARPGTLVTLRLPRRASTGSAR